MSTFRVIVTAEAPEGVTPEQVQAWLEDVFFAAADGISDPPCDLVRVVQVERTS